MKYIVTLVNAKDVETLFLKVEGIEDDTLHQLQSEVGGYIENANWMIDDLAGYGVDCWIAEDPMGKEPTLGVRVGDRTKMIFGNIVFTKHDEEGNTIGLTEKECIGVAMYVFEKGGTLPVRVDLTSREEAEKWTAMLSALEEEGALESVAQA